jgi:hypothetical protein
MASLDRAHLTAVRTLWAGFGSKKLQRRWLIGHLQTCIREPTPDEAGTSSRLHFAHSDPSSFISGGFFFNFAGDGCSDDSEPADLLD